MSDTNIKAHLLECKELSKRYAVDKGVGPVSLVLKTENVFGVIGPNASGKTTLIRCLCELEKPDSGQFSYKFSDIIPPDRLRFSVAFQQPEPWPHLTVIENIMMPLQKVFHLPKALARERAEKELERFGLSDRYKSYPHKLSGGLRQRCVQARTFAMNPFFLYLDEPTSALDPEWTDSFGTILSAYAKEGNMVLLVSHQLNFLRKISQHVFYMKNGLIAEQASPDILFSNPKDPSLIRFLQNS